MPIVMQALRACAAGMRKLAAVRARKSAMSGSEHSSRLRRPKLSIVNTAGIAKRKLTMPKQSDTTSDCLALYPASTKVYDE
jgi:hypothetical protein